MYDIGFMQGRLSPIVDGRIQSFPWDHWKQEFSIASSLDLNLMEWTLDDADLYLNPLMQEEGRIEILDLCKKFKINIPSLTGDCFMQRPFWKLSGKEQLEAQDDFVQILESCKFIGIDQVVVPLVDGGSVETKAEEFLIHNYLTNLFKTKKSTLPKIIFESDYSPKLLGDFIEKFTQESFGINYDIGNSASLGYDPEEEFKMYGHRITNIHAKDRLLGGSTVELGTGNADFDKVFSLLEKYNYKGNIILQTARAEDGDHVSTLIKYRDFILQRFG